LILQACNLCVLTKDGTIVLDVSFSRLFASYLGHMSVTELYGLLVITISILSIFSWRGSQWPVLAAVAFVYHFFLSI